MLNILKSFGDTSFKGKFVKANDIVFNNIYNVLQRFTIY